jgi:hypothetical protein
MAYISSMHQDNLVKVLMFSWKKCLEDRPSDQVITSTDTVKHDWFTSVQ